MSSPELGGKRIDGLADVEADFCNQVFALLLRIWATRKFMNILIAYLIRFLRTYKVILGVQLEASELRASCCLDLSHGLQIPYGPAQKLLQRNL